MASDQIPIKELEYRGYDICKTPKYYSSTHYILVKGGEQVSIIALASIKAAKTVIDTYLNSQTQKPIYK